MQGCGPGPAETMPGSGLTEAFVPRQQSVFLNTENTLASSATWSRSIWRAPSTGFTATRGSRSVIIFTRWMWHASSRRSRPSLVAGKSTTSGGGRANSCSILEAFKIVEQISGRETRYEYQDGNRVGDHICYISNLAKARAHYPQWDISVPLTTVFEDIVAGWHARGRD